MNIIDLKTKGFVRIKYPSDLRRAVLKAQQAWVEFNLLPKEVRLSFSYSNSGAGVGYEEKDGSGPMGDFKRNFDVALSGKDWLYERVEKIQNQVARVFVESALEMVSVMTPFVLGFASEVEREFELKGFEEEISSGKDAFFVRFAFYPPQKEAGEDIGQAHVDQRGATAHLFESAPGIECLTHVGKWIPLTVSEHETVIIPDMQMQLRSNGVLRALWHRVVANTETARNGRYSAVTFLQFQDTPKYDKSTHGRLQEKPEGFNYGMSQGEFAKLFK